MRGTPVKCGYCRGTGHTVLSSIQEFTMKLIRHHQPATGASLARKAEIKETAMNNRIRVLERYGLVSCERDGRNVIVTVREKET